MRWTNRADVTPGFCILWAYLLLVLPLELLAAAVTAACIHELCHVIAVRMLSGRICGITIGARGMIMEVDPMPPGRELVCALAGPVGSFLTAALFQWFPWLSLCAFVQGCFNLLPLYPLDGGRTVRCMLQICAPNQWERIENGMEWLVLVLLLLLALKIRMGIGPVLVWGMLAMRKIPCKQPQFGVQ